MTTKEFIDWALKNGPLNWDNSYGAQCVDLFRYFHNKCVNSTNQPKSVVGAKNFWANYESDPVLNQNYTKIENTPDYVPKEGDVVVWRNGELGHIAIATGSGDTHKFKSLDQNWTGKNEIAIVEHTYGYVYGGLRPKLSSTTGTMEKTYTQAEWQIERDERNKNWDLYQAQLEVVKGLKVEIEGLNKTISEIKANSDKEIKSLTDKHNSFVENLLTILNGTNPLGLSSEELVVKLVQEAVSKENNLQAEIKALQQTTDKEKAELIKENKDLKDELTRLKTEFADMEKKHQIEIEGFKTKLANVQAQFEENQKEVVKVDSFKKLIEAIIKIFKKG